MPLQIACLTRCIVTLIAFVGLFSRVSFQMLSHIADVNISRCKVTLAAFVRFFLRFFCHVLSKSGRRWRLLRWQVVDCTILTFWPFFDVNFHFLQWFIIDIYIRWIHIWPNYIPKATGQPVSWWEYGMWKLVGRQWSQRGWQCCWTFYPPHCIDSLSWYWWECW